MSVLARDVKPTSTAGSLSLLADRIGRGNASWIGPWTVWAIALLLVGAVFLGGLAVAHTIRSGHMPDTWVPIPVRMLVGATFAVGLAWALLTPPFQVPDETSHVAYVQYLSEAGRLPIERPEVAPYSDEERELLGALGFARVIGRPLEKVLATEADEAYLRTFLRRDLPLGGGNATTASANPPLYYLAQAPVYLAASRGSLLTQLLAMRFLSVVLLAASALFAILFVREMLPNSPWTWTAAGLACSFQPLLTFIGAGVNPDVLLFLAAAALFFGTARTLRRGLTTRRACFVAGAVAAGMLTKPLFLAVVPVAVVGIGLAAVRQRVDWMKPCSLAFLVAALPVAVVVMVGAWAFDHPYLPTAAAVAEAQAKPGATGDGLARQASFMWQLFLPRLPFLNDQFPGTPVTDIWIHGLVGVFGWVDYGFGAEAKAAGTRLFLLLLLLLSVALVRSRSSLRAQWPLALCCSVGLVSVLTVVAIVDYQAFSSGSARFEQARYLLPLLALYAGLFGLAGKAVGRRLGYLLLPALWCLLSLHTVSAIILTINRYYV